MKVLTGQFVSAVDANNPAPSDLFYMFQHSSGSKFYGIEAMIKSKASLPEKTLSYAGHTEALMEVKQLEGVVFNYHQGRDWKHYMRFLRKLAKDSQLGFDFMVLYNNKYRKQLADPNKLIHSLLASRQQCLREADQQMASSDNSLSQRGPACGKPRLLIVLSSGFNPFQEKTQQRLQRFNR
ncbi:hypothetical protein MVLG_07016, partial [Microbotryum lychnidis-dioicae p1A1 Lamole]